MYRLRETAVAGITLGKLSKIMTMEDNTQWQSVEPTIPVSNPYVWDTGIGIPPPPPHIKKPRQLFVPLILFAVLIFLLAGVSGFFYLARSQVGSKMQSTPSVIPTIPPTFTVASTPHSTINQSYTATDIMNDFESAGVQPASLDFGLTVWKWSGNVFYVAVHATSSVAWTDASSCSGPCDPTYLGLWVYSSYSVATTAHNDVMNDEFAMRGTPSTGQGVADSSTPAYLHGKCLLLGNVSYVYTQVVDQYCV